MEPIVLLVLLIILFACFTQGIAGFGVGLVTMPLIVPLLGVTEAAALVALISLVIAFVMVAYYRQQLSIRAVLGLTISSLFAIPVGVFGAKFLDEHLVTAALGILTAGYGVYALITPSLPEIKNENWSVLFGGLSGLLSGAYNIGGPPVVMYAASRRWPPAEFKSNIQGMALAKGVLVIAAHGVGGNLTIPVWSLFGLAVPVALLGLVLGMALDKVIDPKFFRVFVFVLLIAVGIRLIF